MTCRKPPDVTERQYERELNKIAIDFEDKFRKSMNGLLAMDNDVTFIEYANKWLEKVKNTKLLNYYVKGKDSIKKFYAYFGNIKLNQITPVVLLMK